MDDERWREIEAVYLAALEAPDQDAFLRQACRDDPGLRSSVELLLTQEPTTVSLFGRLALSGHWLSDPCARREPLAPGSQIGPYRIIELLGSGGSSDVYKASDTRLDRHVALKVFSDAFVTEDFRTRFTRESRTAASLNHPNIATVYEVGESDRPWFIAMEYVDGRTLRAAFADPACSLTDRLGYLEQAASALARAHASGIAHCDLKPDNMMVTREGLVKVLDFGLVRLAGLADAGGQRVEGTIGYMSPEQAGGQPIDARSDVFSFGCVLFEATTNALPFWNPSAPRWLDKLLGEPAPRLDSLVDSVPDGLQALVDDCLVKDPTERLTSMDDVRTRLRATFPRPHAVVNRPLLAVAVLALAAIAYSQWPATPDNQEANRLLMRGRGEMSFYTPEHAQKAIEYFKEALGHDEQFALAHAELAKAYRLLGVWGVMSQDEALRLSDRSASKAIGIDDRLPEAHTTRAAIRRDQWRWAEAEQDYRRALEIEPAYAAARQSLAVALTVTGHRDKALEEIEMARKLDPAGLAGHVSSIAVFYNLRMYETARTTIDEAMKRDPKSPSLWAWRGMVSGGAGDFADAVAAFEKAIEYGDKTTSTRCYYVYALARAGRDGEARAALRSLEQSDEVIPTPSRAIAYLGVGDRHRALDQLEAGFREREPLLQFIGVESYLDELAGEPRFERLLADMELPHRR